MMNETHPHKVNVRIILDTEVEVSLIRTAPASKTMQELMSEVMEEYELVLKEEEGTLITLHDDFHGNILIIPREFIKYIYLDKSHLYEKPDEEYVL